jgi:serine protease AprX
VGFSVERAPPFSLLHVTHPVTGQSSMRIKHQIVAFLALLLPAAWMHLSAQLAPDKYWIQFTDKHHSSYSTGQPEEFLSQRALERRTRQGLEVFEEDLPVSGFYVDSLEKLGLIILNRSRWFNSISVYSTDQELMDTLHRISFVASTGKISAASIPGMPTRTKFPESADPAPFQKSLSADLYQYGSSAGQIKMMKGEFLHNQSLTGEGIHIAVIDAGFLHANQVNALAPLFQSGQILGTRDFADGGFSVYEDHQHGTNVLSVIGGYLPGYLIGTAPSASFWLLRSEDAYSEYLIEEFNWVAAAEFADSAGADILNTSLGYNIFDNPLQNHQYDDMDGQTTLISRAAEKAADRGMLLTVSAGNEGNNSWRYITAPADADKILATGAVNSSGNYVGFSSLGPAYDGRVKPDVSAQGQAVVAQSASGSLVLVNGTSFSAPLIAGLAACLWQAFPEATNDEIRQAIIQSASQFRSPDPFLGYGIPDFQIAYQKLDKTFTEPEHPKDLFRLYPIPFATSLFFESFDNMTGETRYQIISLEGRVMHSGTIGPLQQGEILSLDLPESIRNGVFIFSAILWNKRVNRLIIKY